jgi:hypothetical protein
MVLDFIAVSSHKHGQFDSTDGLSDPDVFNKNGESMAIKNGILEIVIQHDTVAARKVGCETNMGFRDPR